MKRALGILLASLALLAVAATQVAAAPAAHTAKKKKTYCETVAKAVKGKIKAKSKGFYVIREKSGSIFTICQDKPKFRGEFSMQPQDKIGDLHVVKKTCASFSLRGAGHNDEVYTFDFANFRKGAVGQAAFYTVGWDQPTGVLLSTQLSANCVNAFGERVGGVPRVTVWGTGAFGYTGMIFPPVSATMSDAELKGVKITGTGATATATWTDTGVAKSYVYAKP